MAQTTALSNKWHTAIARGVEAFHLGRYSDALAVFEKAAILRPDDPVSHLYIGLAWQQQFVPGAVLPDAPDAHAEHAFRRALEVDPQNWPALVLLAQLTLDRSQFDKARALYRKVLDLDAANADAWCTLGAIAWKQAWPAVLAAQQRRRMPDGALGPPSDASVIEKLKVSLTNLFEEGLSALNHALALDPRNLLAMQWLDSLLRLRASLVESPTDLTEADRSRSIGTARSRRALRLCAVAKNEGSQRCLSGKR